MPNLRHAYLYNSAAVPRHLYDFLRNTPMLETLCIYPGDGDPRDESINSNLEALNIAFAKHAEDLRTLDIRWVSSSGFKSTVGPDSRLTSLAEMQSLSVLYLQMALLCGKPSAILEIPIIDLLPPNLVELMLEEWRWDNVGAVVRTLTQFASDVRRRLHKLKKVLLLCRIPWAWLQGVVPLEFQFEEVKTMFSARGVEFLAEWDSEGEGSTAAWGTCPLGPGQPLTGPVVGVAVESSSAEKKRTLLFPRLETEGEREEEGESAPAGCPGSELRATDSPKI